MIPAIMKHAGMELKELMSGFSITIEINKWDLSA
jgi:hypothetical protein